MNNPKLTNILLIALIAINGLFLAGWVCSSMHQRHMREYAMHYKFRGRFHDSRNFRQCFGAYRSNHGGYYGGFRNYHHARMNQSSTTN
jgi:hypothetical protein